MEDSIFVEAMEEALAMEEDMEEAMGEVMEEAIMEQDNSRFYTLSSPLQYSL